MNQIYVENLLSSANMEGECAKIEYLSNAILESCLTSMYESIDSDDDEMFAEASEKAKTTLAEKVKALFEAIIEMIQRGIDKVKEIYEDKKFRHRLSAEDKVVYDAAKKGLIKGPDIKKLIPVMNKLKNRVDYICKYIKRSMIAPTDFNRRRIDAFRTEFNNLVYYANKYSRANVVMSPEDVRAAYKYGADLQDMQNWFLKEVRDMNQEISRSLTMFMVRDGGKARDRYMKKRTWWESADEDLIYMEKKEAIDNVEEDVSKRSKVISYCTKVLRFMMRRMQDLCVLVATVLACAIVSPSVRKGIGVASNKIKGMSKKSKTPNSSV